jgi:hypothetical protein
MPIPVEILSFLLPFIISVPLYVGGRKLWFKQYKQAEMHTIRSGEIFTLAIGLLHMTLMIVLYFTLFL